jgi:hypothetical protein
MATQYRRHLHDEGLAAPTPQSPSPPETGALYCPECGMPTWVEWSDGGHVKIRCFSRHWFLMLADRLP